MSLRSISIPNHVYSFQAYGFLAICRQFGAYSRFYNYNGIIAGAVVGGIIFITLIIFLSLWFCRWRTRRDDVTVYTTEAPVYTTTTYDAPAPVVYGAQPQYGQPQYGQPQYNVQTAGAAPVYTATAYNQPGGGTVVYK
ncbi:hypothetical protein HDU97_007253 [Phlyctochytrium planicorne]|nr:hypothetical protein HDU97_007253 [Phlyctochytrium planicorne]